MRRKKRCIRAAALLLCLTLLGASAQALTVPEAVELIEKYYVDTIPPEVYQQDTVEGVVEALGDLYSQYYDAQGYQEFLDSMRDTQTVGIGVVMEAHELGARITEVLPGSAAEEAGIRVGDLLVAVEGQELAGMDLNAIGQLLQGEEGAAVTITTQRQNARHVQTLIRRAFTVAATTAELVDGHIGYISCTTFGEETLGHFAEGVTAYDLQVDRWQVDLRSNGGGDVNASVQSAGVFAGAGYLAYLRNAAGEYGVYAREEGALTLDPVVVLTDPYTASASEIFAAAIRDQQQGIVVGERTYGKGVAQILLDETSEPDYFSEGDALKLTAYRMFSSGGVTTQSVGVIPHILVPGVYTQAVADLLCASAPKGDTEGTLRLDMGWRWYIDLEQALSEEYRPAFAQLLSALPESAKLWLGTGGVDGWALFGARGIAEAYELEQDGYTYRGFDDASESSYGQAIDTLATYGILSGGEGSDFLPQTVLTRGELCALLVSALNYHVPDQAMPFSDVEADAEYADAIAACWAAGIVEGYGDGTFRPDEPVSQQALITALGRAAENLTVSFYGASRQGVGEEGYGESLSDFSAWAKPWAWLLGESQRDIFGNTVSLLWTDMEGIVPTADATREQAAALMYTLLRATGILTV